MNSSTAESKNDLTRGILGLGDELLYLLLITLSRLCVSMLYNSDKHLITVLLPEAGGPKNNNFNTYLLEVANH